MWVKKFPLIPHKEAYGLTRNKRERTSACLEYHASVIQLHPSALEHEKSYTG